MKFCQRLIKFAFPDQKGVALFIVLTSMATLAIFVGEITYTAQINQKLAYDRLDQVKALSLAKSGLRLALLRIRAYSEIKKTIGKMATDTGASAAAVNSMIPKNMLEKIWSEPITIPFTGDVSGLPASVRDPLLKFRKDSTMEGKLYISIQAQSNKFNLNSTLPQFASIASPTPASKGGGGTPTPTPTPADPSGASPSATPITYDVTQARQSLLVQVKDIFLKKFESDEKFKDQYSSYRTEDLVDEILGWSDLSYDSNREQLSTVPYKKAPFYHVSELNYLTMMDDEVYNLLSEQFSAGLSSTININTVQESVLRGLVPAMTKEELKKFFDLRDASGEFAGQSPSFFKSDADFFTYLKNKVGYYAGSEARVNDFKNSLIQRGIQIVTDESNFLVHIEATVQQTKKTMEAMVSFTTGTMPAANTRNPNNPNVQPTPADPNAQAPVSSGNASGKSNLKITQMRFL